ncbi:MAG: benzoyl-CoA reductase subunit B [Acidobacteria bacterium]|nr:benzoyl-CoA reductase subunit B [Acidobacteriota bacterium]
MSETPRIVKEKSMVVQKKMLAAYYKGLASTGETGQKVVYTFVPGNLTELILSFGAQPVYPEINALQSGMRKKSMEFIRQAEKMGHSEDVCTYVKCDVGMMLKGNVGPTGETIPAPDLLLCSYTGCFTFMKWFENLAKMYDCPVVMLHVPYRSAGEASPAMVQYVVDQLRTRVIPALEKVTGRPYDEERLRTMLGLAAQAEDDMVYCFESAKNRPSPIDGYFAGVYYIGPIFTAFRGTEECVTYYRSLREDIDERIARGLGPITPEGQIEKEQYRLVVEGPPNWTNFREFWKLFYDRGAVVVASTYTNVGGSYDLGFRHDPAHPLETMARYCMSCYTNLSLPQRTAVLSNYVRDYHADGLLVNSIKSCNSFSAGQLQMLRRVEEETGVPVGFIESDLVDPRYFSYANLKNRLDSFFQMLDQKLTPGESDA